MVGYLKLKTKNSELYETNYLETLKEKNTKISKFEYYICYYFYEFIVIIKYFFNIITVKQIYNAYIFIFPFNLKSKTKHKLKRSVVKLQKLMKKYNVNTLVVSSELKEVIDFKEKGIVVNKQVKVLNGNGMLPYLIKEILSYILEKKNLKTELQDLYVCMNEPKQNYIKNIYYLSNFFRSINIITPKINTFQRVVDKIEQGGIITVRNNKKKSLKDAKFIVNFDFSKEELEKYIIYRRAILIYINENGVYNDLTFDGIQIFNAEIDVSNEVKDFFEKHYLLQTNALNTLYESTIPKNQDFSKVKLKMIEDKIKIIKLYGKRNEVGDSEFLRII